MLNDLPALRRLVGMLQRLPYLASKNVYRVAEYFLSCNNDEAEQFCGMIMEARRGIKRCAVCFNWVQGSDRCAICSSISRDRSIICVVETWHDLISIERAGDFRGLYHVLGGVLCPLEGVGPSNLTLQQLVERVSKDAEVNEIICATNPTPEGEATASFIASKVERNGLKVSRLASGIPMGSTLEFTDRMTIHKAIIGRQPF